MQLSSDATMHGDGDLVASVSRSVIGRRCSLQRAHTVANETVEVPLPGVMDEVVAANMDEEVDIVIQWIDADSADSPGSGMSALLRAGEYCHLCNVQTLAIECGEASPTEAPIVIAIGGS